VNINFYFMFTDHEADAVTIKPCAGVKQNFNMNRTLSVARPTWLEHHFCSNKNHELG